MGRVTLTLPRLGETMDEARVVLWLVAPGAAYRRGDVLMEVETDKTTVEVPALADGRLLAQLVAPGDRVELGAPIAEVESAAGAEASGGGISAKKKREEEPRDAEARRDGQGVAAPGRRLSGPVGGRVAASPAARAIARRHRVDLAALPGSGRGGRVTGGDVAAFAARAGRGGLGGSTGSGARFAGEAPGVVLLHGLFDDHRSYRDLVRRLEARGLAAVAADLPGHGDNPMATAGYEELVAGVASALPSGPLVLVGHSLGAAVAARIAAGRAQVVRLVLIAPFGLGARINAGFLQGMLNATTPAALSRALDELGVGPVSKAALSQELQRLLARRAEQTRLAHSVAAGGVQQIDIGPDLARSGAPVTVLFGTSDRILDWQDVACLPSRVAIHLVRGAGHLPHQADPDLVAALIAGDAVGQQPESSPGVFSGQDAAPQPTKTVA